MNLYLISQSVNNDYDTFDAAVVAAATADDARHIQPAHGWTTSPLTNDGKSNLWAPPEDVTAVLIGEAVPGMAAGVVLASFNAG